MKPVGTGKRKKFAVWSNWVNLKLSQDKVLVFLVGELQQKVREISDNNMVVLMIAT